MGRGNFLGGKGRPIVKYRDTAQSSVQKTAKPIQMPFGLWARIDPGNRVLDGPEVLGTLPWPPICGFRWAITLVVK